MSATALTMDAMAGAISTAFSRMKDARVTVTGVYDDPYAAVVQDVRIKANGDVEVKVAYDADGSSEWVSYNNCRITQHASTVSEADIQKSLDGKFDTLEMLAKGVAMGKLSGAIISGPGGVGKTETLELSLARELGMTREQMDDTEYREITRKEEGLVTYCKVNGHITPLGLYEKLYDNRASGNILIFDDSDSVFDHTTTLNLLKAALDTRRVRVLSWESKSLLMNCPTSFRFEGQVMFLTNKVLTGNHFKALLSRIHHLDMTLSISEVLYRIKSLIPVLDHPDTSIEERMEAYEFLAENVGHFSELNIRVFLKLLDYRSIDKENTGLWHQYAQNLLFDL